VATGVKQRTGWGAPVGLLATLLHPSSANAAVHHFAIPAKPVAEALIDFALQSNLSIGGDVRCLGQAAALDGDFTIEAGLARLLAPTACGFRNVAPDTVLIFARPRARTPAPTPSPSPVGGPAAAGRPARDAPLSDVIVTATKRRALIEDLPYAISRIGERELREFGAVDTSDIAAGQATITTTNLGPGRDKVLLRGLSDGAFTGRTQSTVGLYLDDTPITYNAPDPDLRLVDVQSLEVLRGPQGSLYGGGSLSGIYRVITRKPSLNVLSGELLIGGSETEGGAPSSEVEGVLNLPLLRDTAALRIVGYGEDDGGYIDDTALRAKNVDATTRSGGRVALRLLADADWTVTTGGAFQAIQTQDTQYVTPSQGRLHRANAIGEASGDTFAQGFVTLEREGSAINFRSSTALVDRRIASVTDASTALAIFADTGSPDGVGAYDEPIGISTLSEDAVWSSPNTGRWRWLVGAYGSLTQENTRSIVRTGDLNGQGLTLALYEEHRKDRLGEAALYGETSYALTGRLTATAGLRYSDTAVSTASTRTAPQSGLSRSFKGEQDFVGASPKAALDYRFTDADRVYALVSEARRAGGFNTGAPLNATFSTATGGGLSRRFDPDELWNLEAGVKAEFADRRLMLTSALFYNDWRDIQTDQYLPSGLSYTTNAGDGRNYGLESDIDLRPAPNLLIATNALVDRPQLTRPQPGFLTSAGGGLPGVPDVTFGAQTSYDWPIGANLTARVNAQAEYIGRSHVTFNPALSPAMGGYVLDQISGQIEARRWRLAAYLINITNARGNTFTYGDPFAAGRLTDETPQRPRTLRLTLSAAF
jgi:iron complex outermembrane receptor protein